MLKKSVLIVFILLSVCTFLQGCNKTTDDEHLQFFIAHGDNTDNLVLNETPLFTDQDIEEYTWETHEIHFKEAFLEELKEKNKDKLTRKDGLDPGGSILLGASPWDQFVLVVGGERIYDGYFEQPLFSSFMPIGIVIFDTEDGITMHMNAIGVDAREDERLYELLKDKKLIQ